MRVCSLGFDVMDMFGMCYNQLLLMMIENRLALLGRGCNSELFTYGQAQARVVLKVVSSVCRKEQRHLRNEFQLLKSLEHQHIIKALRYQELVAFQGNKMDKQFPTPTKNILVLEYAPQGSLLTYIQTHQPPKSTQKILFQQVLSAIHYLHSQKIAHRDIKLENVLVSLENEQLCIKLSDFGFASHFQKDGQTVLFDQHKGTRKGYMAPEIHYCQKSTDKPYHAASADIFALGVLLFALVMGKLPFQMATEDNKLYRMIVDRKFQDFWTFHHQVHVIFAEEDSRMQQFQQLFQRMVSYEAGERPTTREIMKNGWAV